VCANVTSQVCGQYLDKYLVSTYQPRDAAAELAVGL